jgi:hypothetical protein
MLRAGELRLLSLIVVSRGTMERIILMLRRDKG